MALISLHVDGKVEVQKYRSTVGGIHNLPLCVWLESYCGDAPNRSVFSKDTVNFHGTTEQIREFAQKVLSALSIGEATKEDL
jgi:hypothetical protein